MGPGDTRSSVPRTEFGIKYIDGGAEVEDSWNHAFGSLRTNLQPAVHTFHTFAGLQGSRRPHSQSHDDYTALTLIFLSGLV